MTTTDFALDGFSGVMLRPDDASYESARRVWNGAIDRHPAFIARCASTGDVAAAVRFGIRHGLPIGVRGGGAQHSRAFRLRGRAGRRSQPDEGH